MTVVELVRRQGFGRLFASQTVSAFGDWMGTVAFMALALAISGSPTAVGGVLALRLVSAGLAGPVAARLTRRWDRRRTMLTMDLARAGMVAVVPLVSALWWVYLWAALLEMAGLVFLPARDSSVPDLVDEQDLPTANGLVLASSYATIPFGAAAFGALSALGEVMGDGWSFRMVFWVDAATFVASFLLILGIAIPSRHEVGRESAAAGGGFFAAFSIPLVRAVAPAVAAVAVGLGALFSLGIVYVQDVLDATETEFGWLIAVFGLGAALGLVGLHRRRRTPSLRTVRSGVAVMGAVVAAFSLMPTVPLALVGAVVFGASVAFTLAAGMSVLGARLEGRARVLAFAAFHVTVRVGLALSAIFAGLAGDLVEPVDWWFVGVLEPARVVLFGCGIVVAASSLLVTESGDPRVHQRRTPG